MTWVAGCWGHQRGPPAWGAEVTSHVAQGEVKRKRTRASPFKWKQEDRRRGAWALGVSSRSPQEPWLPILGALVEWNPQTPICEILFVTFSVDLHQMQTLVPLETTMIRLAIFFCLLKWHLQTWRELMEMESWNEEAWWPINFPATSWVTLGESLYKQIYESSISVPQVTTSLGYEQDTFIIAQFLGSGVQAWLTWVVHSQPGFIRLQCRWQPGLGFLLKTGLQRIPYQAHVALGNLMNSNHRVTPPHWTGQK